MLYIGIDPSLSKTGLCIVDTALKKIVFYAITPIKRLDTYTNRLLKSIEIADRVLESIIEKLNTPEGGVLIYEEPLVTSRKSSALGTLSGVLGSTLYRNIDIPIYTIGPNTVYSMNRTISKKTGENKKNTSRNVGLEVLQLFKEDGYEVIIDNEGKTRANGKPRERVLTTDEAEAFIMVLYLMIKLNAVSNDIRAGINKINRNLIGIYEINTLRGE